MSAMTSPSLPDPAALDGLLPAEPGFVDSAADEWRWLYADEAGIEVDGPPVSFTDQLSAENWLRDNFSELEEQGIATVSLLDGERVFYGPMYLAPDAPGPEAAESAL
jgi:hypothetical protein